jgi:beta-lactam-binding protein with PASTA domain
LLAEAETQGQVAVEVDTSTGFLAGPFCPREHVQRIQVPAGDAPNVICPIHNPTGVVAVGSGELPDVIGYDLGSAVAALNAAGFEVKVDYQDGGSLSQGTVFGQNPSAGFPAQAGSAVRLTVAGPEPGSVIPSVVGFPIDHALSELDAIGVTVEVIQAAEANPDDAARRSGVVWKQDPAAGAPASGTVRLWVNP